MGDRVNRLRFQDLGVFLPFRAIGGRGEVVSSATGTFRGGFPVGTFPGVMELGTMPAFMLKSAEGGFVSKNCPRSGQVSWVRFFRGFSSPVRQMSGSLAPKVPEYHLAIIIIQSHSLRAPMT